MTIPSTPRKAGPYTGTGTQTTWPFTFKVFAETDLEVTIADTLGIETVLSLGQYTVTLNPNQETSPGGTVTYLLPDDHKLTILGNLPYDQPLDLPSGGNFSPLALENELDRLTMQIQQLREKVGRAIQVSVTTGADVTLPAPEANQLIGWDQNGSGLQNYDVPDLFAAAVYADWLFDTFAGDGVEDTFVLQRSPGNVANCDVSVDGQTFVPNTDFTISGAVLRFTTAPNNGAEILVRYGQAAQQVSSTFSTETQTATAGQTVFNLTGATYAPGSNNLAVYVNGLRFVPGVDFTETDSNTVTMTSGLQGGDEVLFVCGRTLNDAVGAEQVSFIPAGTGAVGTNVQAKLREFVSVKDFGAVGDGVADDTAEVQAAVTHCFTTGDQLYWPDGTYLTTASISNFHSARHIGPGAVLRGSSTFYVQPKGGQTNTLYVRATGGSNTQDGLSNTEGVATLQTAFNILKNYWPLDGKWVIELAAGTYTGSAATARLGPPNSDSTVDGAAMRNAITIKGPDVGYNAVSAPTPTPTAIMDAAGAAAVGIQLECGIKALVRDIRFNNYNGSTSSSGITVDNGSWLQCINVHADTCNEGIGAVNHSLLDVKGGTINNCTRGIRSLFNCKHEIGNQSAGAAGQGPFITNCVTGFLAQECSTGHADYVTFTSNGVAIDAQVNARVNFSGSDFKLNTVAVRSASGSNIFPLNVVWNTGTGDANTENIRIQDAGSLAAQNSNFWRAIGRQTTTQTVNGIASASVVWTGTLAANLYTSVPSSTYLGKALKVLAAGTITGVAGTKTIHLRLGGSILSGITFDAANNGVFVFEGIVYLTSSSNQKTVCRGQTAIGGGTEAGYGATTFNTASSTDQSLTLTTTLSAADTIVFELVDFEVQG